MLRLPTYHRPALLFAVACMSLGATGASATDLTVHFKVADDAATQGQIQVALFGDAATWLKNSQRLQGKVIDMTPGGTTVVFHGLAPGRYAVSAFLDQDGDGKLSTNVAGIPREPYGFSRDVRGRFAAPGFDAAAVDVQSDTTIEMTLK